MHEEGKNSVSTLAFSLEEKKEKGRQASAALP